MWFQKKINSDEYLELKADLSALKIELKEQKLELALILTKLKFKYKITKRDLKEDIAEEEDIKTNPLLTEDGMVVKSARHNK